MRFTINSQVFAHEVRLLNRVISTKSALPVLSNIRVEAVENELHMAATDYQVALTTSCKASVEAPGLITLPAKKLLDMLEHIPDTDINITLDRHHVRLQCGSFKSRLQALSADEFPALQEPEGEVATLPAGALKSLIERTIYAISDKTSQYILKGALLTVMDTIFALVATDGKRLSIATATCQSGPKMSAIVPVKALEALADHCIGKFIEFSSSDRHLFFVADKRVLMTRVLEGQFPKYERIIPRDCDKKIVVDRAALTSALHRVGTVADDAQAIVFTITNGVLSVSSNSAEIGDANEQISVRYEGPDLQWRVHGGYAIDFLEKATQPTVSIDVKNEKTPLLFTDGPDFVNVIMGMS